VPAATGPHGEGRIRAKGTEGRGPGARQSREIIVLQNTDVMTMPIIYCISELGREPIADVDSVEAVEGAIRVGGPGCYHVDEISGSSAVGSHEPAVGDRDQAAGWGGDTRPRPVAGPMVDRYFARIPPSSSGQLTGLDSMAPFA
jgi:hypothetical protein